VEAAPLRYLAPVHLVSLIAVVVLAVGAVAQAPVHADELDRYLERQRQVYQIPAIVVGVIRAGQLVDSRASGLANIELNVPARAQHVFEIGSISKQFTSYAILMLYEQGKVDLRAPVGRYLTDLPERWGAPTLHQLMSHTSGLPDFEEAFDYGVYRETPSDGDFLKRLVDLPIEARPGQKWSYANTNYWLLARVIEKVGGLTYAQYMQERIFTPLGMTSTRSALPSQILIGRAAGYRLVDGHLENRDAIQPHTGRGLGDIASTVADMARWEQEQRQPRLLKPETVRLSQQAVTLADGSATTYGYGWMTDQILPVPTLQHSGQTAGFAADFVRVPSRDLAIVLFANLYGAPTSAATGILRLVEPGLSGPPLVAAANPDARHAKRVREFAATAAQDRSGWREEWFTTELWQQIKPNLQEIEATYRLRGALQSVTAVGPDGVQDRTKPSYRVVFENMTRVIAFEFDEQGRIKSIQSEDE
jgi:CubicO group peptidase (beta-lactamase class C family)